MVIRQRVAWVALGLLVTTLPLTAHHSVLPFDGSTPTTVTGVVTRVLWQNPHAYVSLDVRGDRGTERWTIESEAPVVLDRLGWKKGLIAAGDLITTTGARARDGRPLLRCAFVELADGRRLPCFPGN